MEVRKIFCYCHIDGEIYLDSNRLQSYNGGRTVGVLLHEHMIISEFVKQLAEKSGMDMGNKRLMYELSFDKCKLLDLINDDGLKDIISFSDQFAHLYATSMATGQPSIDPIASTNANSYRSDGNRISSSAQESSPQQCIREGWELSTLCTASTRSHLTSEVWLNIIVGPGQSFESADAFRVTLYKFAIANKFKYKFGRNTKAFISVDCSVSGCKWHLTAYSVGKTNFMKVGTFNNQHSHIAQDLVHIDPCYRGKLTSRPVVDKLRLQLSLTPNQIRSIIENEHGILLNYKQSWRCKEQSMVNINGRPEDSYRLIPWICQRLMETDQSTVAKWTSGDAIRFSQLFIAYGSSIVGFLHGYRTILFIDGCHLSGPYRGTLLSACAINADNQMFPLAYAVVSSESYEDRYWFLKNVKEITGSVKVTIVSDRHHSIRASVAQHYGHEYHAYCYRHIKENFEDEVRKLFPRAKKAKEDALKLLDAFAYVRIEKDYDVALQNLRLFKQELASWVLANEPEHWVMSEFSHPRWDHITSNIAKSFNSWILKERHHSIFALINEHRDKLAIKLFNAKAAINSWKGEVGHNIEEKLRENIAKGEFLHVVPYNYYLARVTIGKVDLSVDLATMSCTCGEWEMIGIPCCHASAVIRVNKLNIYDFVQQWYKKSKQELIYQNSIKPVEMHAIPTTKSMDRSFIDSDDVFLLPPITKVPAGRPQVKWIESQFNEKRDYSCSRCHVVGHSRRSCKNPNPS